MIFGDCGYVSCKFWKMDNKIIDKVIKGVGDEGGTGNVLNALGLTQTEFQSGFDIANKIQNMDLIKLLYSNYNQNKIIVEFTLLGKQRYHDLLNR
jgi:hypothetical protein